MSAPCWPLLAWLVAAHPAAAAIAPSTKSPGATGPVVEALQSEVARALSVARPEGLERPYYISAQVIERSGVLSEGVEGELVPSSERRARWLRVTVRVGGHDLDQTGFDDAASRRGAGAIVTRFPLDDHPLQMRRAVWLALDDAWRQAAATYASKLGYLGSLGGAQSTAAAGDFTTEPARREARPRTVTAFDRAGTESLARRLSATFRGSGLSSRVRVHLSRRYETFVDTEGSAVEEERSLVALEAVAWTEAEDGMPVREVRERYATDLAGLGKPERLEEELRELALSLRRTLAAPRLEAPYHGPVLLEGLASAEVLASFLRPNVGAVRPLLSASGGTAPSTEWSSRIGSRVLDAALRLRDDPGLATRAGQPLVGAYRYDLEGIRARPVELVTRGMLRALLGDRYPRVDVPGSDGHARLVGGMSASLGLLTLPSTLVVESAEGIAPEAVRQRFLEEIRLRNLPFGIVVRKLDNDRLATLGATDSLDLNEHKQKVHEKSGMEPPVVAARVTADGREEPIRGLRWGNLRVDALRDVLAATPPEAPEAILNALFGGDGNYSSSGSLDSDIVPFSVVAPGRLLLEEAALEPIPGPFVPHPVGRAARERGAGLR